MLSATFLCRTKHDERGALWLWPAMVETECKGYVKYAHVEYGYGRNFAIVSFVRLYPRRPRRRDLVVAPLVVACQQIRKNGWWL